MVEGARLESVCRGNSTEGSNPSLSANFLTISRIVMWAEAERKAIEGGAARVSE